MWISVHMCTWFNYEWKHQWKYATRSTYVATSNTSYTASIKNALYNSVIKNNIAIAIVTSQTQTKLQFHSHAMKPLCIYVNLLKVSHGQLIRQCWSRLRQTSVIVLSSSTSNYKKSIIYSYPAMLDRSKWWMMDDERTTIFDSIYQHYT